MSIKIEKGVLHFSGDLTFAKVQKVYEELKALRHLLVANLQADFAKVDKVDTSAIALCLELKKMLPADAALSFVNVSEQMQAIAKLTGVSAIFNK